MVSVKARRARKKVKSKAPPSSTEDGAPKFVSGFSVRATRPRAHVRTLATHGSVRALLQIPHPGSQSASHTLGSMAWPPLQPPNRVRQDRLNE
jgi:hypothetical protein